MAEHKQWGHDELAHDLANSLRANPEHIVWENMQMGPSGSIRPDVYLLKKRYATFAPVTYEVKISVSDFRSDITSGKWQGYLSFSSAVIFAVPVGLIKKEDVPAGCGLIVRHDEVWRMVKKPTMQHLETLPRESWLKLVIDGIGRAVEQRDTPKVRHAMNCWGAEQRLRKQVGDEIASLISKCMRSKELVEHELQELEKQREDIRANAKQELQWAREAIERDRAHLTGELKALAEVLGLPAETSVRELAYGIRRATSRLAEDAEVNRLRNLFERIQQVTANGVLPLPGEQLTLLGVARHG
ncbi:MmcB family DNA repair protein [Pseudomonas sp. BN415]|uniref:MmcB family DNA repair protein n=1 Tax=Pseudomonas sp. BN415 TaxID=2567889 RepID=UPI002455F6B9|nr:MmcB family DNA repair protein [Pseudomonas sp. BN415]MDH4581400.1 MmcB family DNA repair protein [Pseudomonas sp. BN415]